MNQTTIDEGKTIAIISYLTFIGLIVAYLMNNSKNNEFAKFHIGQSVRIVIAGVANSVLSWFLPGSLLIITKVIGMLLLVLIILGIVNAVNGKMQPLPVIGTVGE
ncbi:putative membrane protein [Flavobacteriaceae bacterium MAR_2009_75]|nr:putative membrane protein [Flavobacteriaceae bacterium MAR_2009_75]